MLDTVWLDWGVSCRRSVELCRFLDITPHVLKPGRFRTLSLAIKTVLLLAKVKPRVVLVASMRLAALLTVLKPIFGFRLVVDCHYSGIIPGSTVPPFLHGLFPWVHRNADLVLVTNSAHADCVEHVRGRAFILQDRIPASPIFETRCNSSDEKSVVVICSYNEDEPVDELLDAATYLAQSRIKIYFTGNSNGQLKQVNLPDHVVLTGYLPEYSYWQLLNNCNVIVDLTSRENCLVCGAYEAVAMGKPLVLTDTAALRGYFSSGVVYTANTGASIAESIRVALAGEHQFISQMAAQKRELVAKWQPLGEAFRQLLLEFREMDKHHSYHYNSGVSHG